MASLKTIKNNYGLLTMQERFSLFQQACHRADENEINLIIAQSPRKDISAVDFFRLRDEIYRLDILNLLERLHHCRMFELSIREAANTKNKKESDRLNQFVSLNAYLYKTETDAWQIVCDELGFDANCIREATAKIYVAVEMMNVKDKFIRDCAFDENEANKFLKQFSNKVSTKVITEIFTYEVFTLEEKIVFYRKNIESL